MDGRRAVGGRLKIVLGTIKLMCFGSELPRAKTVPSPNVKQRRWRYSILLGSGCVSVCMCGRAWRVPYLVVYAHNALL